MFIVFIIAIISIATDLDAFLNKNLKKSENAG
jgi:hypothetical protein